MASGNTTEKTPGKKVYQTPTLTRYGRLKDLTTGGSGKAVEGKSGKRPRP
jgi:hypothetical protein